MIVSTIKHKRNLGPEVSIVDAILNAKAALDKADVPVLDLRLYFRGQLYDHSGLVKTIT